MGNISLFDTITLEATRSFKTCKTTFLKSWLQMKSKNDLKESWLCLDYVLTMSWLYLDYVFDVILLYI